LQVSKVPASGINQRPRQSQPTLFSSLTPRSIRHCSCRRHTGNMCSGQQVGDGLDGAAIDVTKGREILPGNVIPTHYDVTLEPAFDTFKYKGTVVIDLTVVEDTTSISLNTLKIEIMGVKILSGSEAEGEFKLLTDSPEIAHHEDSQTTKISFPSTISKGSFAQLQIEFVGELNDKMAGFYRSTYKNTDGSQGIMATSQMEPTDCRRAFPCFDEPALKAAFTITLIADKKYTCLSNMDVHSEQELRDNRKVVKFKKSPIMSTYLVAFIVGELKIYAPVNQEIEHGRYALELAARTLEFYEKTFDSDFPLPKMDMNWGLVTYRVVDILFDEKNSGASRQERVAKVVQHELAHQWFGNLVTMDFWDGLWLNEGFATWMSWYSCNKFYPEWKVALGLDSLRSSHPIEVPVKRVDEVNQIFDAISYSKGSCVIRMISAYLGEDVFMEGIRIYLKRHAYSNTQTGDLWAALSEASGKDKVGFPVVGVTENEKEKTITVKQNRFLRTADVKPEEDETLFPELVLSKREQSFEVPDFEFFKLNADSTNIYRTSYTPARLEKLGQAAKDGLLTVEDRVGIIADAGALAASGYQKTSGFVNAWIFEKQDIRDGLKSFCRDLVSERAHKMGWEFSDSDNHIQQQFKAMLFRSAGAAGDAAIIAAAQDMFKKFAKGDSSAIPPNIRGSEYETILKTYYESKNSDERNTALRNLGRAKDPELIEKTLSLTLNGDVKGQDIYLSLSGLQSHPEGIEALYRRFSASLSMLGMLVQIFADIEKFFHDKSKKGYDQSLAQSLDAIRAKIAWLKRDREDVAAWVKAYQVKNVK
ncbi:aminopeptidase 2, partial [Bisporella sp. PMI_857]